MIKPSTTRITFFESLVPLILSGKKTITIRDDTESHHQPNTHVEVFTLETDLKVCEIKILRVEKLAFDDIDEYHAKQEGIPLDELKMLIKKIYPNTNQLHMISFQLLK